VASKKGDVILKNFSNSLSDSELQFFASRLHYQYQDDLADVFDGLADLKSKGRIDNCDVDYWLQGAKSAGDFYKQVDQLSSSCLREYERRGGNRLNLI
jgi:hypothetical protein